MPLRGTQGDESRRQAFPCVFVRDDDDVMGGADCGVSAVARGEPVFEAFGNDDLRVHEVDHLSACRRWGTLEAFLQEEGVARGKAGLAGSHHCSSRLSVT